MIPDCDGRSDGQTESIIANTALCIALLCWRAVKIDRGKVHRPKKGPYVA